MKKLIDFLLRKGDKVSDLKSEIVSGQEKDIQSLARLNKKFRILLEEGEIELVIRSVRNTIKETKK
jgi:hypothetical protein